MAIHFCWWLMAEVVVSGGRRQLSEGGLNERCSRLEEMEGEGYVGG